MEFLLNFRKTLSRFWSPIPAVIALGVLSALELMFQLGDIINL